MQEPEYLDDHFDPEADLDEFDLEETPLAASNLDDSLPDDLDEVEEHSDLELEEQDKSLISYIKETYHYRGDRVGKALKELSEEEV